LDDLDKSLELSPNQSWQLSVRGDVKRLLGKLDDAMKDFDLSISIDSSSTWAKTQRNTCLDEVKKRDASLSPGMKELKEFLNDNGLDSLYSLLTGQSFGFECLNDLQYLTEEALEKAKVALKPRVKLMSLLSNMGLQPTTGKPVKKGPKSAQDFE